MTRLLVLACLSFCIGQSGCIDIQSFEGNWSGTVIGEEALRQGFSPEARVDILSLSKLDLRHVSAIVTTSDGKFSKTQLSLVAKYSNDSLASLTFDGAPLRTYLLFSPVENEEDGRLASIFISLFSDDHVEMRVIRGNDLFGVFHLERQE
jgi:hypothetical protein